MEFAHEIGLSNVALDTTAKRITFDIAATDPDDQTIALANKVANLLLRPVNEDAALKAMFCVAAACNGMDITNAILLEVDGERAFQDRESQEDDLPLLIAALKNNRTVQENVRPHRDTDATRRARSARSRGVQGRAPLMAGSGG